MTTVPARGRVALVTGATSGIGRATAVLLAASGTRVLVAGRDAGRGARVVDTIRAGGGAADFLPAPLRDAASARSLAARAEELAGPVDILVNNAAAGVFGPTAGTAEADFDEVFALNVKVPYFLVGALAPGMVDRGHGVIVNVSSMVAGFGSAGSSVYASSKAALNLLTRSWAAEFGPGGVRVNAVAPGPTRTEGTDTAYGTAALERLASRAPAGRVARPEEIARAIAYLAGDDATFVHGVVLSVDGGRGAI